MPKKGEYVKLKNFERKSKSTFMTYVDFQSILVPEDNGKQNSNEFYTNKYQKYVTCSYGYKLVWVDDNFSNPFKSYLGEDAVFNFISIMTEESKYCSDVIKNILTKNLSLTKEDNEDFKHSIKYWISVDDYNDNDNKVIDHCHISGKYRGSRHRNCTTNVKPNDKIPAAFHNLKNYESHLIMQDLGKFSLQSCYTKWIRKVFEL